MKSGKLILFGILFGIAAICSGAPPSASSLREVWQGQTGKCGRLDVTDGIYKFAIASERIQNVCVGRVGTDFVVFEEKPSGKVYTIVPMPLTVLVSE